jgi:hypothetical protein
MSRRRIKSTSRESASKKPLMSKGPAKWQKIVLAVAIAMEILWLAILVYLVSTK